MAQDETLGATLPDGRNRDELILAYAAGELGPEDEAMVEQLLVAHPELRETVALYWSLRLVLATDPFDKPGSGATARSRAIFDSKNKRSPVRERLHSIARVFAIRAPQVGLAVLAILLLVLPFGVSAASETTPGESLYPIKRSFESLKLALTLNPGRRAEFNLSLADVRVREINELISRKQYHLLQEPLADYEMHVTNAVRGLSALTGDELSHLKTASDLETGLEKIRRSLTPVSDASPPQVKANVTHLLNKADAAEAFLKADRELVRNEITEAVPPAPDTPVPAAAPDTLEPSIETPILLRATQPPMGVVATAAHVPTMIPLTTVAATDTSRPTMVPSTSTLIPPTASATPAPPTPIATAPATPTVIPTLEPTEPITPTSAAVITPSPTMVNTIAPSATPTDVPASETPMPTPSATIVPATETPAPATPTELLATGTAVPTDAPIPTDTPVPIETPTPEVQKETPTVPGTTK